MNKLKLKLKNKIVKKKLIKDPQVRKKGNINIEKQTAKYSLWQLKYKKKEHIKYKKKRYQPKRMKYKKKQKNKLQEQI